MKKYTKKIEQESVNLYKQGVTVNKLSFEYGIPRSTIYHWLQKDRSIAAITNKCVPTLAAYERSQKQLDKIKLEFEIFQKLHCFKDATTKEKEIAISKYVGVYPIKVMCRLLDLPTGTFYNYHFRRKKVTQNQLRDEQLKQEIVRIFKESE